MSISIGEARVEKGNKVFSELYCADSSGDTAKIPFYLVNGTSEGPIVCITAGVHGTEYAGIEASLRLYHQLDPKHMKGAIIGCPMCNFSAFTARSMFVNPVDGKNLNYVFPGSADGSITEVIAHTLLTQFVAAADYHIDMHSGDAVEDLFPYVFYHRCGREDVDTSSKWMAESHGVEYIAVTELAGAGTSDQGNFYSAVSEMGVPSIQPEAGGIGILEEECVQIHYQGIRNVLSGLNMIIAEKPAARKTQKTGPRELSRFLRPRTQHDGLFYPSVKPGQRVQKGDVLGVVTDYTKENEKACFVAEEDGVILWVMVSPAAATGDALMGVGIF